MRVREDDKGIFVSGSRSIFSSSSLHHQPEVEIDFNLRVFVFEVAYIKSLQNGIEGYDPG